MAKELEKMYNPRDFEDRIYQFWLDGGYFTPTIDKSKPMFSICLLYTSPSPRDHG